MSRKIGFTLAACLTAIVMTSCKMIDDDLDDCGVGYAINYELRLVTNMSTEIETVLDDETDTYVVRALRDYLKNIFTDNAHDVDLSFYDVKGDSARLRHEQHIMDDNQATYTLYLPVRQYMHTTVANVQDNTLVGLADDETCHKASLTQGDKQGNDTIAPHETGIFSARLPMNVVGHEDQTFFVRLYMVNCASALVIDTSQCPDLSDIRIYSSGFANSFGIADSIYMHGNSPVVRTERLTVSGGSKMAFCSVNFPSPEADVAPARDMTRMWIETTDPFMFDDTAQALWQYDCYVTLADGTTTRTQLYMRTPLRAGQLKITKAWLKDDGSVQTDTQSVGVSVTLDWKKGGEYEPEL